MDSPTQKNKKCISKIELLEKLNSHKKKLLGEVQNKTYELQQSIQNTLEKLSSSEYVKSCESMEDYLSIIQKLNKDFNDLEDMSNDFVKKICQLRVESVTVKNLIDLPDRNESKLSPITISPNTSINPITSSPLIRNPSKSQQLQDDDDDDDDDQNRRLFLTPNNDKNEKIVIGSGNDEDKGREETSDRDNYDNLMKSIRRKLDTWGKVVCENEEKKEVSEKLLNHHHQ